MATEKQIEANRRNARKSTGPKTDEGKAASSRNAMRHGILSEVAIADHEDGSLYLALQEQLMAEHEPVTGTEFMLLEQLALLFWRMRRLARAEAFETIAVRKNVEFETSLEKKGGFVINRLPKYYRAEENILAIDTQLLVGRYQTMLSNQITQTLAQLRQEKALREKTLDGDLS
ncbi:hypothetical protein [Hyphomonas sp. CY54-11-8]|uniref:hypothetical protein n=1 Tax=Hyphomonas sp. CY54-11-8 TaxID=1280944 RepID=UPI000458F52D|nr:hypothetical protein [Hyphomonas sp. CY54-11-8]KCZ47306.1 hypothetical protein HY17_18820 [Hyphomonas sp. CY54-11-8]